MDKSLDVVNITDAQSKVSDIKVVGNVDLWQLLCKASSVEQGWMKSTKAMYIDQIGCLIQVTTQQGDQIAESVTFIPGVKVVEDENGGRKLVPFWVGQEVMKIEGRLQDYLSPEEVKERVDRVIDLVKEKDA